MNIRKTTLALASVNQGVLFRAIADPAEFTLDFISFFLTFSIYFFLVNQSIDVFKFFKLVLFFS
jgi:hypothetical protein